MNFHSILYLEHILEKNVSNNYFKCDYVSECAREIYCATISHRISNFLVSKELALNIIFQYQFE